MSWEDQWSDPDTVAKWRKPSGWVVSFCDELSIGPGMRALDLGCGPGRHAVHLASEGFETYASDFTEAAVGLCREAIASRELHAEVIQSDMAELPYPGEFFDLIVAYNVIYHATRTGMDRVVEGLFRILKPGGHLLVTLKSPEEWVYGRGREIEPGTFLREGKGVPIHFCREDEIIPLLSRFEIQSSQYQCRTKSVGGKSRRHARWMIVARRPPLADGDDCPADEKTALARLEALKDSSVLAELLGLDLDGAPVSFGTAWTKIRRRERRLEVLLKAKRAEMPTIYVRWPEPKPTRAAVPGRRAWLDGFLFQVFPEDDDLPGLTRAADPEWVRDWLVSLGLTVPSPLDVEVVRYKPATRCVLLYAGRDGSWVGKLYRPGEAAAVFEKGRAIFEAFSDRAPVVRPLALEAEQSLLLMERVVGRSIDELAGEERRAALDLAGGTLARLHQASIPDCPPRRSLELESRRAVSVARKLEDSAPQFAREARRAGDSIAQKLLDLKPLLATCHGECDAGQFVIGPDRAWIVDPDAARQAHPASDLGSFLATLWRFQLEEPPGAAAQAFLAGYREAGGEVDPDAVLAFEAVKHLRVALIHARRQKPGWTERVERLLGRSLAPAKGQGR